MKITRRAFLAGLAAVPVMLALDSAIVEPNILRVERVEVSSGDIGARIALLTDLHFDSPNFPSVVVQALGELDRLSPDLIVVTGDLVSGEEWWDLAVDYVRDLTSITRVALVWGNHDHWHARDLNSIRRQLEEAGVSVLVNENTEFEGIALAGVDDPYTGHDDLASAMEGLDGDFRVLLAHSPQIIGRASGHFDLVLSGHTHGGQVVIPFLGPPFVPLPPRYRRFVAGMYGVGRTWLYVSRGLGTVILPVRFNCPPELTLIELTPEARV